jgi:putative Holliday junction resolvase
VGRVIGLDFGSKRIGVAVSDDLAILATPHGVLRRRSYNKDAAWISELISETKAEGIVLGCPVGLSGDPTEQTRRAQRFGEMLAARVSVPVKWWDERLTTVRAQRISRQDRGAARTPRASGRRAAPGSAERSGSLDAIAAALILQGYLDHRRLLADSEKPAGSGEASELSVSSASPLSALSPFSSL